MSDPLTVHIAAELIVPDNFILLYMRSDGLTRIIKGTIATDVETRAKTMYLAGGDSLDILPPEAS